MFKLMIKSMFLGVFVGMVLATARLVSLPADERQEALRNVGERFDRLHAFVNRLIVGEAEKPGPDEPTRTAAAPKDR